MVEQSTDFVGVCREGESLQDASDSSSIHSSSADSYRPIHSLLLCPAQWSALLESPVSLVRTTGDERIGKKSCTRRCRRDDTSLSEDSSRPPSDIIEQDEEASTEEHINIERTTDDACKCEEENNTTKDTEDDKEEEPIATNIDGEEEPKLSSSETPASLNNVEKNISTPSSITSKADNNTNDDINRKSDSLSRQEPSIESSSVSSSSSCEPQTPAHLLPLSTPLTSSFQGSSSEGSCTIDCSSSSSESASVRGEEAPGPSVPERTSVPTTPIEARLPSHFSHSRNVSETPSLPPFVSSSTSSAYHSRNSSMASQITSDCFESDSQYTDIDSVVVTYSSEMHTRPMMLQEARFKFPEVSAMEKSIQMQCYSIGDLNATSPICVPEHLFMASPTLDETLKNRHNSPSHDGQLPVLPECGEENQLSSKVAGLKSSEWIKRELRMSRQSMIQVKVSSKSRHIVHFNVKAGDMFVWEFATKRKDIAFGLSFEATEVATEQQEEEQKGELPDIKMVQILPVLRVNTHVHPIMGSHAAPQDGVYELLFDNSYSRFFAKELYYRITTRPSIPNEHYEDQ